MSKKKSLYEILEVAPNASFADIRASHDRLLKALEGRQSTTNREDYNNQLRLLKVAFSTLSAPMSRDSYDAHLSIRDDPARPSSGALVTTASADQDSVNARAAALLLRADAMSLRADAMGLRADMVSGWSAPRDSASQSPFVARLLASSRTVLLTLGTIVAIGMVFKVAFSVTRSVQATQGIVVVHSAADDKLFLQEYYQTWGVRPASRAEAQLLDAERHKKDEEKRQQRDLERDKLETARREQQFEADARRRGEQVTAEVDYAALRARQAAADEDRQKEYDKNAKIEAENARQEAQRAREEADHAKWQRVLQTSANNN